MLLLRLVVFVVAILCTVNVSGQETLWVLPVEGGEQIAKITKKINPDTGKVDYSIYANKDYRLQSFILTGRTLEQKPLRMTVVEVSITRPEYPTLLAEGARSLDVLLLCGAIEFTAVIDGQKQTLNSFVVKFLPQRNSYLLIVLTVYPEVQTEPVPMGTDQNATEQSSNVGSNWRHTSSVL